MDSKETVLNLDLARSMSAAAEQAWQLPRIWFTCWWNLIADAYWLPRDFSRRD